jgi:uncharacterized phage protein (TIGR01671 family)
MPEDRAYYQHYMSFCGNIIQSSSEGMSCFGGQDNWRVQSGLQLMQFTGLLDANGVEIYEGDIVSDHLGVGLVRYSEKHAAFRVSYGDGLAKWFYDYILKGERESIVVIGNIHQNKELLNHG